MRYLLIFLFSLFSTWHSLNAFAGIDTPKFSDYRVDQQFEGKLTHVKIVSAQDKEFKTVLQRALHQKPNFAGHYVMLQFGCGASCVQAAVVDAQTGDVFWLPFTVCCSLPDISPINYRLDSSLIEINGSRNETGQGTYYYNFSNGNFVLIKEVKKIGL